MAKYRIFTNDRGMRRGVRLYSALKDVGALTADAAVKLADVPRSWHAKAVRWPPDGEDKAWLAKHVGEGI
jgi:hypothetical protein